jgi:hypothetical protein
MTHCSIKRLSIVLIVVSDNTPAISRRNCWRTQGKEGTIGQTANGNSEMLEWNWCASWEHHIGFSIAVCHALIDHIPPFKMAIWILAVGWNIGTTWVYILYMTSIFKTGGENTSGNPHIYSPLSTNQHANICRNVTNWVTNWYSNRAISRAPRRLAPLVNMWDH